MIAYKMNFKVSLFFVAARAEVKIVLSCFRAYEPGSMYKSNFVVNPLGLKP